jgi:hypothetical protein
MATGGIEENPARIPFEVKMRLCAGTPNNGDKAAGTEKKLDFATKMRLCAGSPDNDDEMAKALQATQDVLSGLQASVEAGRRRLATETPRISASAPVIPIRRVPRKLRGPASAPLPAGRQGCSQYEHPFRLIGPSRAEHDNGWNLDLAYHDFRDRLAGDLRAKKVKPDPAAIRGVSAGAVHQRGEAAYVMETICTGIAGALGACRICGARGLFGRRSGAIG